MPFGAEAGAGGVRFRLWAPAQKRIVLDLEGSHHAMNHLQNGWHELLLAQARPGARYRYLLADGLAVPDPASRANPDDAHGPSEVVDPLAYQWRDAGWRGRPWHEAVVYELHVGTFTPEGTFAAARGRLAELAALGITAIELMPVADFPGRRNWGYDGVLPFAPDACYGTPDELKALVDAAHALGLMVLLDVVYNHFGPEGNYLHAYCPQFFDPARHTPWGAAIAFGQREVREFFVHNALYWVEEFGFDGLRLDAVHAIRDDSAEHIVCEIGRALREGPGRERQVHLVLENDRNEAHLLGRLRQRAVERRPAPRAARAGDGRGRRLLRRLRRAPARAPRARAGRGLRLPGRALAFSRRRAARRAERRPAAHRLRLVRPDPRPGRQPRLRRAARRAGRSGRGRGRARLRAARAPGADAVHGRGIRRPDAVPVLLRLRPRARRRGHARPARRVRALRLVLAGDPRPQRRGDLPALQARLVGARPGAPRAGARAALDQAAPPACRAWRARAAERTGSTKEH